MKISPHIASLFPPLIFVLYFWDVFVTGEAVMTHDSIMWYGNFNYFLLTLAEGFFPLWDSFSFSGSTFFTNFNSGLLDPFLFLMVPFAVFGDVSALDLFHSRHLIHLLVYYWGVYFLCFYLSKKPIAALFSSSFAFFLIGTNSLRQNGWMCSIYLPWIFLFLLKLFSASTPARSRQLCFVAICYLTGLSLNIYIPSYLFIFTCLLMIYFFVHLQFRPFRKIELNKDFILICVPLVKSIIFIFLPFVIGYFALDGPVWTKLSIVPFLTLLMFWWFFKIPFIVGIFKSVGWKAGFLGTGLFIILAGPFLLSLTEVLPNGSENFGYVRSSPDSTDLAHISNDVLSRPQERYTAGPHYLIRFLMPFTDIRYFMGMHSLWETNLFIGIVPLILCFLFFRQSLSLYKGLFLFLSLSLLFLMICPEEVYETVFKYFPGYSTIRVLLGFSGFFLVAWAGLLSICLVEVGKVIESRKNKTVPSLKWLFALAFVHMGIVYYYLTHFASFSGNTSMPLWMDWFEENLISHAWILWGAYLAVALFLKIPGKLVRIICCCYLGALTLFQLADFIVKYRLLVIQPAIYTQGPSIHNKRSFEYQELRVPTVPRLGPLWGYLAPMYRVPTAGPAVKSDYLITGRRAYDLIRRVSLENYRILTGVGAKRYGFFDKYLLANDSIEALKFVGNLPSTTLKTVLILEDEPDSTKGIVSVQGRPEVDDVLKIERFLGTKILSLYDLKRNFVLSDFEPTTNKEELVLPLPENISDSIGPWDKEHMGYFQLINNFQVISFLSSVFFHNPLYSVAIGSGSKNSLCFTKKYIHAVLPYEGEPRLESDKGTGVCDLYLRDENLVISKVHWREEMIKKTSLANKGFVPEQDLSFMGLSRGKVTPDRSPYPRDEKTEVLAFGPNHIRFKIDNSKAGLFYYADSYSKYWKAWVDGERTKILRANFNFKAVYVDKGEHVVEFRFEPDLFIFLMGAFILVSIPGLAIPCWAFYRNFSGRN